MDVVDDVFEDDEKRTDTFGLENEVMISHQHTITNVPGFRKKTTKPKISPQFDDSEVVKMDSESLYEYKNIIQELEKKISLLKSENESLKNKIEEQRFKIEFYQQKNASLIESNQEQNAILEQNYKNQLNEEIEKYETRIEEANTSHRQFRDAYIEQIKNLELQIEICKRENTMHIQHIKELDKQIKELLLEKEALSEKLSENEANLVDEHKKLVANSIELNRRENLVVENELLKKEIESLNSNLEILSAKINQNSLHFLDEEETNSLFSVPFNYEQSPVKQNVNDMSFKNEINFATSEELVAKIEREKKNSDSLKSYIDKLKLKIKENFNELFTSKLRIKFDVLNSKLYELDAEFSKEYSNNEVITFYHQTKISPKEIDLKQLSDIATYEQQKAHLLKEFMDDLIPVVIEECPKIFEIKSSKSGVYF